MSTPVYKHYDQASLNHQYNNRELVPNYEEYFELWARLNKETKSNYASINDIPYGPGNNEKLDFYPAAGIGVATMIFIHGGYWQMMARSDFAFIAQAFVPHHIHTVIIGYPLATTVSMDVLIQTVRRALTWIHHNIREYGGDPTRLYLSGHSAGGHLASLMMTDRYAPDDIQLKGVVALSGLYDLIPIQRSHVNEPIGMDEATAIRCSSVPFLPKDVPLILAVGGAESEEYHAQTLTLADRWRNLPKLTTMVLPEVNHFSILSELLQVNSALYQHIHKMIS